MRRLTSFTVAVASLAFGPHAEAQPRASQHGTVSQEVSTTTITLEYDRPVLRGRSVFGDILDYDVVWTPGANRTTWIDVSEPVKVQGQALDTGRPVVGPYAATLLFHWGDIVLPLRIEVAQE